MRSGERAANRVGWRRGAAGIAVLAGLVGCGGESPSRTHDPGPDARDFAEYGHDSGLEEDGPDRLAPFDWCEPDTPPDRACYAARRDPGSASIALAEAVARSFLARREAASLAWNWEEAVGMFALAELSRVTGDPRYREYVATWLDHHIVHGYAIVTSDTCAPALPALALLADTEEPRYRQVVDDALRYLFEEALRDEDGGINHLGTTDVAGVTLWVDSLFMVGVFLTRYGEWANDARALDEVAAQIRLFTRRLQDGSGFYTHAWNWVIPQDDGVFWARGNAWVAAATADYLRARRNRGESDPEVEQAFSLLIGAVLAAQDPATGLWWTVINRPGETYLETSASALFAWALARAWRYGLVGDEVLAPIGKAVQGLAPGSARTCAAGPS